MAYTGTTIICKDVTILGTLSNQTISLQAYAPFGYTITEVYQIATTSGTCTAAFQIGGVNITGLSAIAVTSSPQNVAASGANVVAVGNALTVVISSASTPVNLMFTIAATRNLE